jgi:hypothetical protein
VNAPYGEVDVEISEHSLSMLGWEVSDFRARVTTARNFRNDYEHKLSISGVFRFNKADWTERFSFRDYPISPAMLIAAPSHSPWKSITALELGPTQDGQVARIAQTNPFLTTPQPIDYSDIQIEIAGYDGICASSGIPEIPRGVEGLPVHIEDETNLNSINLTFDQMVAFTHCNSNGKRAYGQTLASGRVVFGSGADVFAECVVSERERTRKPRTLLSTAPFWRSAPTILFDVLDQTGFLLETVRSYFNIEIRVDEEGQTPSRSPRWLVNRKFDLSNYTAPPNRVIARIEAR